MDGGRRFVYGAVGGELVAPHEVGEHAEVGGMLEGGRGRAPVLLPVSSGVGVCAMADVGVELGRIEHGHAPAGHQPG